MKRSILFLSLFLLSLVVLTSSVSAASWNKIQEVDVEVRNESWVQIQQVEVNLKPAAWYQIQVVEVELIQAQWVLIQTVEVELKHEQWVLVQTVEVELEQAQWSLVQTVEVELEQAEWVLIQTVEVNIVIPSGQLVWTGAGADNLASNPENWNEGIAPYNGVDIVFNLTSVKDCIWDIDASLVTVNSLTLATGYTGTLTQGDVDIGIGDGGYLQEAGTITGNVGYSVYISGSMTVNGGTVTADRISLVFTGDGYLSTYNRFRYRNFEVIGNLTVLSNQYMTYNVGTSIFDVSGTLNLGNYEFLLYNINGFRCDGAINDGQLILAARYSLHPNTFDMGSGVISSKIRIYARSNALSDVEVVGLPASIIDMITVDSEHDTYTCTLNINGQSLTANGINVGLRGAIIGDGTIINAGDLDVSSGSFSFIGHYIQAGNGKITLGQGQKINDLTVYVPIRLTLGSDLTVQGEIIGIKNIILNGYRLYFSGVTSIGEYPSEFYVSEPVFIPIKTPVREVLYVYGDIPRWMKYDAQKGGLYGVPVGIGLHDFNITCYSEYTDLVNLRVSFAVLEQTIQKDDFRGQSIGSIISIILSIIVIGMCGITRGPDGKMDYQISNVLLGGAVVVSVLVFASVIPSYGLVIVAFLLFALYWGGRR